MGPLLFALAIPELADPNKPDPGASWNYALDPEKPVRVERGSMPARWDWPLAAPLKLHAQAMPIAWELVSAAPALPRSPLTKSGSPVELTLVPYGCTKFRISMFPVVTPETSPR